MVETLVSSPERADTAPQRERTASPHVVHEPEAQPELEDVEWDEDSSYGDSDGSDGATSITSSVLRGYFENGRRYQTIRETGFNVPSDERQWISMEAGHLSYLALDSEQANPLFRSPISENAQNVLDLGTGQGGWPIDVADRFPHLIVRGIDLYPPPQSYVPPNCFLEVDDITKPFTWGHKFDLIHMRLLLGALPRSEWKRLYRRVYLNLQPGGWIEHVDVDINVRSSKSNPLPPNSLLGQFRTTLQQCANKAGNATEVTDFMREEIEEAGFINVHEQQFQMPIGVWPKHAKYKEAGAYSMELFKQGLEGWCFWALTKYGSPTPWSPDEVQVYLAKMRQELDRGYHTYQVNRRVWAQKPFDAEAAAQKPVLEDAAAA